MNFSFFSMLVGMLVMPCAMVHSAEKEIQPLEAGMQQPRQSLTFGYEEGFVPVDKLGAVRAGIEAMLQKVGYSPNQINAVHSISSASYKRAFFKKRRDEGNFCTIFQIDTKRSNEEAVSYSNEYILPYLNKTVEDCHPYNALCVICEELMFPASEYGNVAAIKKIEEFFQELYANE